MRIILTGASGVGKTTILERFHELPKVQEVARTLMKEKGIKLNEDGDFNTQELIWNEYERRLSDKGDYISDRGLVDVISYTTAKIIIMDDEDENKQKMIDLYKSQLKKLKEFIKNNRDIIYVYVPIEFKMEEDGVRSNNEEYRKLTAQLMYNLMYTLDMEFLCVTGSIDERVEQIKKYIDEQTSYNN